MTISGLTPNEPRDYGHSLRWKAERGEEANSCLAGNDLIAGRFCILLYRCYHVLPEYQSASTPVQLSSFGDKLQIDSCTMPLMI
jgi:hypothetical protein